MTPALDTAAQVGQRDVVLDVLVEHQAVALAVFGDVGDAVVDRLARPC